MLTQMIQDAKVIIFSDTTKLLLKKMVVSVKINRKRQNSHEKIFLKYTENFLNNRKFYIQRL